MHAASIILLTFVIHFMVRIKPHTFPIAKLQEVTIYLMLKRCISNFNLQSDQLNFLEIDNNPII